MTVEAASAKVAPEREIEFAQDMGPQTYRYLLVFLLFAAAAIRFWNLDVRGFWIDEGFSWGVTRLTWSEFLHGLTTRAGDMTVYYFLLKVWSLLGTSEFALRSLSVVAGIATVPLVAAVGKSLYSRRAGIIAAALFTVHVYAVHYDREARPYGLILFFAALSWRLLSRIVRDPERGPWLWFALVSILQVNSQLISGLNLATQFVTLAFVFRDKKHWRRAFTTSAWIAVGLVPAVVFTLIRASEVVWVHPTDFKVVFEFLDDIAGQTGSVVQAYGLLTFVAAFVVLLAIAWRKEPRGERLWAAAVPAVGFLFPVLVFLAVCSYKPMFVPRYLIFTLLPVMWGVGAICSRLNSKFAAMAAVIVIGLLARGLPAYYREPAFQDFRGAVQYITLRQQPGDAIMIYEAMARPAMEYYFTKQTSSPDIIFPLPSRSHFMPEDILLRPNPYTLPDLIGKRNRIWFVYKSDKAPEEYKEVAALYLQRMALRTHRLISVRQFRNIHVEEFER